MDFNIKSRMQIVVWDLQNDLDIVLTEPKCRVPDDWLLKTKRPLLHGREALQAVVAAWQSSS